MFLQVDQRTRTFLDDDALIARATEQAQAVRDAEIALAKSLLEMRETRAYLACRCSSVEMFGGRLGYEPHEVRRLLKLAEAMDAESSVEERIQAKALSVPKAVELAPILNEPSLFDEKSSWVKQAVKDSYSKTRRDTRRPGEGRVSAWRRSAAARRSRRSSFACPTRWSSASSARGSWHHGRPDGT